MTDDLLKPARPTDLRESVSSGRTQVRDSQGDTKPAYLQQPDVIVLPTAPPQGQGDSQPTSTQSVANNNSSSKGE